jgi:hypothetical protein
MLGFFSYFCREIWRKYWRVFLLKLLPGHPEEAEKDGQWTIFLGKHFGLIALETPEMLSTGPVVTLKNGKHWKFFRFVKKQRHTKLYFLIFN